MNRALLACVTASASTALVATSVVAVTSAMPPPNVHALDIQLTAGDEQDIVIDFVRHGQTTSPSPIGHQGLPGFPLSDHGEQQATDVGNQLFQQFGGPDGVAGIFAGQNQRMFETATPFAHLEQMDIQTLSGINEVGGGIFSGASPASIGEIVPFLIPLAWAFGLRFVPMPGSNDYNGMQFAENVDSAVNTMYSDALANPVVSANGHITDVAFSGEAMISAWTLMNVNNPDVAILLPLFIQALSSGVFLPDTGQVVIEGNPTDGWTLDSFNGEAIPQNPGLLTDLIVDVRNLITPPQMAAWDTYLALLNDPTTFGDVARQGLQNVGSAIVQFPGSVSGDIVDEVKNFGNDLVTGESFSDAFGSAILGLT